MKGDKRKASHASLLIKCEGGLHVGAAVETEVVPHLRRATPPTDAQDMALLCATVLKCVCMDAGFAGHLFQHPRFQEFFDLETTTGARAPIDNSDNSDKGGRNGDD